MEKGDMIFVPIDNIVEYKGFIPSDSDLAIAEKGNVDKTAIVLYGFDEVGLFDLDFKNPIYGFIRFPREGEI